MRAVSIAVLILLAGVPATAPEAAADPSTATILRVGLPEEARGLNPLGLYVRTYWSSDVLSHVYDAPVKITPHGIVVPYLAKGVDAYGDGAFDPASEYGVWTKRQGIPQPLVIVAYYDFNGVRWHDGTQMTVWDLVFSYHLAAMSSALLTPHVRPLLCAPDVSYDSCGRQMAVSVMATRTWLGEAGMPGDASLRAAVRLTLSVPYAEFETGTLAPLLLPMHIWSRTGGGRHADFGCAIWIPPVEAAARGVPECGNANPARWGTGIASTEGVPGSSPYEYAIAESWSVTNVDVIGSGPFRFVEWVPNVRARIERYNDYYVGDLYDPRLARYLHRPYIDGVEYRPYRTAAQAALALQDGLIDVVPWNFYGSELLPDLLEPPDIQVVATPGLNLYYMAYNFRREPWGYRNGDPAFDSGHWLRQAVAHLVDKESVVRNFLNGLAVVGHGPVSPSNVFWHNPQTPRPAYDVGLARAILDDPMRGGLVVGPDPPGPCSEATPAGCRNLTRIGKGVVGILTLRWDYDPARAAVGELIAEGMRKVGINAVARHLLFGDLVNRIVIDAFDLYILAWSIGGTDPDFLYYFFSGQNFMGFQNATFDQVILASRAEMDRARRRQLIFEAQEILADARPYEVLYHRDVVQAYRRDRYVNWTVVTWSLWNEWSLFGVRPPQTSTFRLALHAPSAIGSYENTTIILEVTDEKGGAIAGAAVNLVTDAGTFTLGNVTGPSVSGFTDQSGRLAVVYHAPGTDVQVAVRMDAEATHPAYGGPVLRSAILQLLPHDGSYLVLTLGFPVTDLVRPGGGLPMTIDVRDQEGALVPDAVVTVTSSDSGTVHVAPSSGSAANMAVVSLQANPSLVERITVRITVSVTRSGYLGTTQAATVTAIPRADVFRCPTGETVGSLSDCPVEPTPSPSTALLAVGFAIGGGLLAAAAVWRWRRTRR